MMCRPILEYCSPAWHPWLSETNTGKLERIQKEAARRMTGPLRTTTIEAVTTEANLTSVSTQSKRAAIIAWEKSVRLSATNPGRSLTETIPRDRLKKKAGWETHSKAQAEEIIPREYDKRCLTAAIAIKPLWQMHSNFVNITINTEFAEREKQSYAERSTEIENGHFPLTTCCTQMASLARDPPKGAVR